MSRETRVGRAMFDIKDLIVTRLTNQIIESLHQHKVETSQAQLDSVLSEVQSELEKLFNNATDSILRASRD